MNAQTSLDWRHATISVIISLTCMLGYATYKDWWTDWFPPHEYPNETLPEAHRIDFYSHQIDDHYRLFVQVPHGYYDSENRYGVVYATDGGGGTGLYIDTILPMLRREQIPQMIFVGIANASRSLQLSIGNTDTTRLRDFGYSAPVDEGDERGNEKFHRFIEDNIKPFINATYRTKQEETALGGHSLGAFFGLYVMFRHPESYKFYFASSPTLFWNSGKLFEEEEQFYAKGNSLPVSLYLSVAERESPVLIDHYHQMTRILDARNYQGLRFKTEVIPNETHTSVVSESTQRGLRFLYQ